jgi:hypothetical protein
MRLLTLLFATLLCATGLRVADARAEVVNDGAAPTVPPPAAAGGGTTDASTICLGPSESFLQPAASGAIATTCAEIEKERKKLPVLALGGFVTVKMETPPDCSALSVYLLLVDGMSTGIGNSGCNAELKTLSFQLSHSPRASGAWPVDREAIRLLWQRLLHNPWQAQDLSRRARISIQHWTKDGAGPVSRQQSFDLKILDFSTLRVLAALIGLTVLALAFYGLHSSGLLRDRGILSPRTTPDTLPFSLARSQMAWWFGLVFLSYVFLWVVCAELPVLSNSAMILLGIAGATGMAGTAMDNSQRVLEPSEGWLKDVTTDAQGVTLYRLQHVIWTAFFGLAFLIEVFNNLAMPEFDTATLGLMGISAGAYIGFKMPESRAAEEKSKAETAAGKDQPTGNPKALYGTQ